MLIEKFNACCQDFINKSIDEKDDQYIIEIDEFLENSTFLFIKSLLSAEFLKNETSFREYFAKSTDLINSVIKINISGDFAEKLYSTKETLLYCYSLYKEVVLAAERFFKNNRTNYVFTNVISNNLSIEKFQSINTFFEILFSITKIDLYQSSSFKQLQDLNDLQNKLDSLKSISFQKLNKLIPAVELKLKFLAFKTCLRLKTIDDKFNIENIHLIKEVNFEGKLLTWKQIAELHYKNKDFKNRNVKKEFELEFESYHTFLSECYYGEFLNNKSVLELHICVKYFKDFKEDTQILRIIKEQVLNRSNEGESNYDKYCSSIFKNYVINNYFSSYCNNNNIEIDELESEYKSCDKLLSNNVSNYFLQYKYLNKLLEIVSGELESESEHKNLVKHYSKYSSLINETCSKLLESYFHSKEWSVKNTNYVMMLQYDDCIYNYKLEDDENVDICFISSFVLPVNNNELEKQFEETKQKFRELKATLNVIKSLKNDLLKLEQLNHEYIKKDQRSIETLGIFTAIIAFIVSTVGNFKFVENVVEAIAFMTTLASSLCIFLGVLLIIIDRNRIKSHLSKWFLLFNVCLNIIGWSYLILK